MSSILSSAKIFQKWGLDLLACSFILFILGFIVILVGGVSGEQASCELVNNQNVNNPDSQAPPNTGNHEDLAKFYSQQLGYTVKITQTFCDCRKSNRCSNTTHGCTSCSPGYYHWGYDFSIRTGDPIVAAYPGKVIYLDKRTPGVFVENSDGSHVVIYNHINIDNNVYVGMPVNVGTLLGRVNKANHLDVKKTTNWRHWGCGAFNW